MFPLLYFWSYAFWDTDVETSTDSLRIERVEELEEQLAPLAGSPKIRALKGTTLTGTVQMARLPRVAMLSFDTDPMHAVIPAGHGFCGVTVSKGTGFAIRDGTYLREFAPTRAHLLAPEQQFDFQSRGPRANVLGANFFVDLAAHAEQLGETLAGRRDRIALDSATGTAFSNQLWFVWNALHRGAVASELNAVELEDGLIAALVWAVNEHSAVGSACCGKLRVQRAEDYIAAHLSAPITREALARIVGVSVRTLSRSFTARHGVGPRSFIRQRRLEAVHDDLLRADGSETSVSEVATRYGFTELGRFAGEFRARFGELPSATLRR